MVKGHNKGNDPDSDTKNQGTKQAPTGYKKEKGSYNKRNAKEDPSKGRKGKNSI